MKTAVSIPDELFTRSDRLARQWGVSRSELYSRALAEFLGAHEHASVTAELDALYGQEHGDLDGALEKMQFDSIDDGEW